MVLSVAVDDGHPLRAAQSAGRKLFIRFLAPVGRDRSACELQFREFQFVKRLHFHAIRRRVGLVLPNHYSLLLGKQIRLALSAAAHNLVAQILVVLNFLDILRCLLLYNLVDVVWAHSPLLELLFPANDLIVQSKLLSEASLTRVYRAWGF